MLDLVAVLLKGKNDVSTSESALPNDRKFVRAVSSTNCANYLKLGFLGLS